MQLTGWEKAAFEGGGYSLLQKVRQAAQNTARRQYQQELTCPKREPGKKAPSLTHQEVLIANRNLIKESHFEYMSDEKFSPIENLIDYSDDPNSYENCLKAKREKLKIKELARHEEEAWTLQYHIRRYPDDPSAAFASFRAFHREREQKAKISQGISNPVFLLPTPPLPPPVPEIRVVLMEEPVVSIFDIDAENGEEISESTPLKKNFEVCHPVQNNFKDDEFLDPSSTLVLQNKTEEGLIEQSVASFPWDIGGRILKMFMKQGYIPGTGSLPVVHNGKVNRNREGLGYKEKPGKKVKVKSFTRARKALPKMFVGYKLPRPALIILPLIDLSKIIVSSVRVESVRCSRTVINEPSPLPQEKTYKMFCFADPVKRLVSFLHDPPPAACAA